MSHLQAETLRTVLSSYFEAGTVRRNCSEHHKYLSQLAGKYRESGDLPEQRAASLLSDLCSMMFSDARTGNPWGPFWTDYGAGKRSMEADDLEKEHLEILGEIVYEVEDLELKARIADILWTRGQGYQFGQIAIAAYSEESGRTDESPLFERLSRLKRAANIARRLGRQKALHTSSFDRLDQYLDELSGDPSNAPVVLPLLQVIYDHQLGDPAKYTAICESSAARCSSSHDWNLASSFWELASSWHHRQGLEDEALRCRQAAAKELVARGQDPEGRKRYGKGYSAGWILRGLTALKNSGGNKEEIDRLSSELQELQKEAREDLHTVKFDPQQTVAGYEEGLSEHLGSITTHLSGRSLQDAIVLLCNLTEPTDVPNLKSIIREGGAGLLTQMFTMVATDSEGKETDKAEGIGWNGEVAESDLLKRMYEHARTITWPMACEWFLDPGRRIIAEEHAPRIRDLVFLVSHNPFILPGHEGIFLRGIHAGFEGDFLLAIHFLVPQLESSLRRYLKQSGVLTWVHKEGLQKELDLGGLLSLPRTKELLGENLVFDLRGILTEKFGENLRNDMAHGNMPEASFYRGAAPLYFWWLILRMVWMAYQATYAPDQTEPPSE